MLASNWLTCYGGYCGEPMLGSLCTWCYKVPREQEVKNEPKYMNCNASSFGITSLMTMSKNPALSQKVLQDWLRMPERPELFAGLTIG